MSKAPGVIGSASNHGGSMISASGVNMLTPQGVVCLQGDMHSCPIPGHGVTAISGGCTVKTIVNGRPVAIEGSIAGCGAVLVGGLASKTLLT